eukprot:COSAG02_NODE_4179_length_5658_cov_1.522396_1_plen_363_part_00
MTLSAFEIEQGVGGEQHQHHLLALRGGMSAELGVEKSLGSLTAAVSHSWRVRAPGAGPENVDGRATFLQDSLNRTVELYERLVDQTARNRVKTAVIGPAPCLLPYLVHYTNAVYLPTHFLLSFTNLTSVQRVLAAASASGIDAYAVGGVDYSMPGTVVAWIKLRRLPLVYKSLLQRWGISEAIVVGTTRRSWSARRIPSSVVGNNEVYLHATSNMAADRQLYRSFGLSGAMHIPLLPKVEIDDWESGIGAQVEQLLADAGSIDGMRSTWSLTSTDTLPLYEFAVHVAAAGMRANGNEPVGVAMLPYYVCHPLFEELQGYVPFPYWQGNNAQRLVSFLNHTIAAGGLQRYGRSALARFFFDFS